MVVGCAGRRTGFAPRDCAPAAERQVQSIAGGGAGRGEVGAGVGMLYQGAAQGGEAEGATEEAHSLAEMSVSIPMPGKAESLNAGVAGAVLMFEVVRQRKILTLE